MLKNIAKVWTFQSDSNPSKSYESLKYSDGTTSCNCPGWTRRVERSCKHTRLIDMGLADGECTSFHEYEQEALVQAPPIKQHTKKQAKPHVEMTAVPARRILWQ